ELPSQAAPDFRRFLHRAVAGGFCDWKAGLLWSGQSELVLLPPELSGFVYSRHLESELEADSERGLAMGTLPVPHEQARQVFVLRQSVVRPGLEKHGVH